MEYYSTIKRVKYWSLVVKNPPANIGDVRDVGSIPGSGRSPGRGHGNPLQYFCLKNPMDRGAWWATVHGIAKSWTRLSTHTHTHTTQAVIAEVAGICWVSHGRGLSAHSILSSVLCINLLLLQQQCLYGMFPPRPRPPPRPVPPKPSCFLVLFLFSITQ